MKVLGEAAKAKLANPGIGVTSASRRRRSIDTFPPQEPRIPGRLFARPHASQIRLHLRNRA